MGIEMNVTDVFDAGKTKQEARISEPAIKKMRLPDEGSCKEDIQEKKHEPVTFKKAFDSASKETDKKCTRSEQGRGASVVATKVQRQSVDKKQGRELKVKCENCVAKESADKKVQADSGVSQGQMIAVLKESLAKISQELNLDINLNGIELGVLSDAALEDFAEIVASLQGILQVLSGAVEQKVGLEINGTVIEPEQAVDMMKTLRVELFNIQLALESLGVAGTVARTAAEKLDTPIMDGGVPHAQDPAALSMTAEQREQLFGNLLENSEEKLASVVARIAAIAQERITRPQVVESNKAAINVTEAKTDDSEGTEKIAGAVVQKPVVKELPADCSPFDTPVLRRLLKLDTTEQQQMTGDNKPDARESKPIVLTLTSNQSTIATQNFQQVVDSSELVAAIEVAGKSAAPMPELPLSRMQILSQKVLEELVINQVSQKLSTALKSGMHEVRLVLRPESLGEMRMTIKMDGDIVMARIYVENQQVKQIIESNLNHLRNALEEHNLQAGDFDVNVNQGNNPGEQSVFEEGTNTHRTMNGDETIDSLVTNEGIMSVGTETGRRFGTNSIEFFA